MKKFMTNIKTLAALLIAGAAFTACSSSDDIIAEQPVNPATQKYTLTVKASKGGDATTRALSLSGSTLSATWTNGEEVKVYEGENELGTLAATNSSGATCTLTGDLDIPPSASGVTLTLKFNSASISGQNGTLDYIASHNDYATATTTATISGNTITGTDADFTNQNAIARFTLKNGGSVLANPSQLTVSVTTTNTTILAGLAELKKDLPSYTFDVSGAYTTNGGSFLYFALPSLSVIVTEMNLSSELAAAITGAAASGDIKLSLTATVGSDTYTYTKSGYPFAGGQYYEITVNMTKQAAAPTGALTGQFTISNDGGTTKRQVVFSKGNLQAVFAEAGSTCTWKFADNQYDYVGNNAANTSINGNGSVSAAGTVDLFGWVGASSSFEGAAMYGVSNSSSGYGNTADTNLKSDWGNTMGDGWFTLKKDEWTYLITGRTDANQKYGFGNVGGVNGMILLPDSWTLPDGDGLSFTSGSGNNAWINSYTTEQWSQMEGAGAVFLPAVGYRSGSSVGNTGSVGEYWTSTPRTGHGYFSAYYQKFEYNSHTQVGAECNTGCSVRLVRLAE